MPNTPTRLTELPIPNLIHDQLQLLTLDKIHSEPISHFDVKKTHDILTQKEGSRVIGADFGGDKGVTKLFVVQNGQLVIDPGYEDYVQGNSGAGYLTSLEKTAAYAEANDIPVGLSWGAPLEGSRGVYHPKLDIFFSEFTSRYQADFSRLVPSLRSCINDGPAGLISGAVEAYRVYNATEIILAINGGGLGLAAIANGQIYSTEAGHAEGHKKLNTYHQTSRCGVFDATYTCIEQLGANKAGIETQWQTKTGSYLRAIAIEDEYKAGTVFAGELYDHSAWVVAHMIQGAADALAIDMRQPNTAIVGHGGAFKFPYYGERVQQMLGKYTGTQPRLLMTKDFGDKNSNACLDGAALAALI